MRAVALVRAAYGALLLVSPAGLIERIAGENSRAFTVARCLLGARHLGQALVLDRKGGRLRRTTGTAVDLLHLASLLPIVAASRTHRRAATLSSCVAAAFALRSVSSLRDETEESAH